MAELSAETQAIIERLKAEGNLIRNSGTNSIRSVKIQLDRFENVFNTISANISEQTGILRQQNIVAQEALETQRTKEQLEELQVEKQKYDDNDDSQNKETDKKIEDIGNSITRALSLKNIALAGAGLFVGYNLLKGFINEQTNGGWSAMEESIANINWADFSSAINAATASMLSFNEWMDGLPALLIGGGIAGVGVRSAARGVADSLLSGGGGAQRRGGALRGLTSIRTGILGAVTGLAIAYGDDVEDWLVNEMKADPDVAGVTVNAAQYALTGATLGSMFGPPGILIGAVAGLAIVFGQAAANWIERQNAEAEQNFINRYNEMGDVIENALAGNLSPEEIEELSRVALEARERIRNATSDTARAALEAASRDIEEALLANVENKEIGFLGRGTDFDPEFRAAFSRYYDTNPETGRSNGDDSGIRAIAERLGRQYDEGSWLDKWFWGDRDEFVQRSLQSGLDAYFFDRSDPNRVQRLIPYENMEAIRENFDAALAEGGRFSGGFRYGTNGFQDFGNGTLSVLHGREAVVPYNTAAGRFLDQYFTENWEPRIANAQRLQTAAQGGGGGAVIINAPTTVSPVVNNVSGGRSVNQVSIRGSGGGGGGMFGPSNPYGLPHIVN